MAEVKGCCHLGWLQQYLLSSLLSNQLTVITHSYRLAAGMVTHAYREVTQMSVDIY